MGQSSHGTDWTRRDFLRTLGASVPSLRLMAPAIAEASRPAELPPAVDLRKFRPIDLTEYLNCSSEEFGRRPKAKLWNDTKPEEHLIGTPGGMQAFRGIPFHLGPVDLAAKRWLALSTRASSNMQREVQIPIRQAAGFLCMAAFCDWDRNEDFPADIDVFEQVGQALADVIFVYVDGSEERHVVRRRFEVSAPVVAWGHLCYTAVPCVEEGSRSLNEPLPDAEEWGRLQMGVQMSVMANPGTAPWISAIQNPHGDRELREIRFVARAEDPLVICGLTLFHGNDSPLRHERLRLYRFTLPSGGSDQAQRWQVSVDLGVVARTYTLGTFDPAAWLVSAEAGLGERADAAPDGRHLYAEVVASRSATLTLRDTRGGTSYAFELDEVDRGQERAGQPAGARVEFLEPHKTWIHGSVSDTATGRPTPVRLAFRSKDGRYIPPYGHRSEVNDAFFQDYGADLKLGDASFAYVDGSFQVELPVGEVYVEITKGYEFEAIRQRLDIQRGQRELKLQIPRLLDLRSQGWVSADTHVHFLPASTGVLEGQAEGLNLVNILAAQLGDLFTNVGDFACGPLRSADGDMLVSVGTENRQHLLGHISLLGGRGAPVFPMSASGPEESYLGDPLWNSLAEWADECRERGGLAVAAHFPYPTGEIAADIIMGKLDAIELWPGNHGFDSLRCLDWYRALNCGYRLPVVGGTDKMGANEAVGANRVYAHLGDREFTMENWTQAVRSGNTFMSTGPLLLFTADGRLPGQEIKFRSGGGTLQVEAKATCFFPMHRLEIVFNGRVVAARDVPEGAKEMVLKEEVRVPGPGWIAARCSSRYRSLGTGQVGGKVAHTSPVYIAVPGQEVFSAPAASYLLTLVDGAQAWVDQLATRPDAERFAKIRGLFVDARTEMHRRMHQHGIPH